jgi:hypothetical protein
MRNVLRPVVLHNMYSNMIDVQFNSKFWNNFMAMCLSRERIRRNDPTFNTLTSQCDFPEFFYRFMTRHCYDPLHATRDKHLQRHKKGKENKNGDCQAFITKVYSLLINGKANEFIRQWENSFFSDNDGSASAGPASDYAGSVSGAGSSLLHEASASAFTSVSPSSLPMPDGEVYV